MKPKKPSPAVKKAATDLSKKRFGDAGLALEERGQINKLKKEIEKLKTENKKLKENRR